MARDCNNLGMGIPYLTGPADFPNGHIQHTKFTNKPTTICRAGDILVTVKGSGSGTLVEADADYCISRQLMAIRATSWNPTFLRYSLLQNASRIKAASTGLIPGLSRSDILDQPIPVPSRTEEQRAIATALSDADELIGSLEALIAKKRAIKQAAMQELLTGRTRLPGFEGEWEVSQLGDLGTFAKGRGIARGDLRETGARCVRYGELYTRYKNYMAKPKSRIPPEIADAALPIKQGDLLFAGSGETAEDIGICVAYIGEEPTYAGGDIIVLKDSGQDAVYLAHLLNAPVAVRQKARMAQGDAIVHIRADHLAEVELPLPPLPEQRAVAAVLSDMDAEIAALDHRLDKTRAIRQGMMQQLLTGAIRLPVPDTALHENAEP